jgi:hypothetical protein
MDSFVYVNGFAGITHEKITFNMGSELSHLWKNSRAVSVVDPYSRYSSDVPMVYENDVYETDPITGSIFDTSVCCSHLQYTLLHNKGEAVLDNNGDIVYRHYQGDIVLDGCGKPISSDPANNLADPANNSAAEYLIDIVGIDLQHKYATEQAHVDYLKAAVKTIVAYANEDIASLDDELLEKTKVFYMPKISMGAVQCYVDSDTLQYIDPMLEFLVVLYVDAKVAANAKLVATLTDKVKITLWKAMSSSIITHRNLHLALDSSLGNSVQSFDISLLTTNKLSTIRIADNRYACVIKKRLEQQPDGKTIAVDAIDVKIVSA